MKNVLLTAALLTLTTMGWAQSSKDDALDVQVGECSTYSEVGTGFLYWKYTASKDLVVTATDLNNSYTAPDGFTYDSDTKLQHANMTSPMKAWNLSEGETIYFRMTAKLNKTVGFTFDETDYIAVKGTSATAPTAIEVGPTYFFGDCHTSGTQSTYVAYTATENGDIDLTLLTKATSVTIDGTTITPTNKHYKQSVTAGNTYNIVITYSRPIVGSLSFTASSGGTEEPTQGTLENPFELKVGENKVPAAAGTYYYTYTPTTTGYFNITSDETLESGKVNIYNIKAGITYSSPAATSSTGYFNVSTEVTAASTQPYYVEVVKTTATEAEQTFNFEMKDYEAGEKSSNPKLIDVPSEQTLPRAACKFYYKVTVPANTEKNLVVEVTNTTLSGNTKLFIYPEGSNYYSSNAQNTTDGFLRYDVSATEEKSYIIYWYAQEDAEPISFKVYYEEKAQGTSLTNPLIATLGENTLVGSATQYYKYTAASTGKLSITAPDGMSVKYPEGTDTRYDGYYDVLVNGNTYSRSMTKGEDYLIEITNATAGEVFTVEEGVFQKGETQSNPIEVEADSYTVGATQAGNIWLSYTAPKDGTLTVKCDAEYDAKNEIDYGLTTDDSLYPLLTTTRVDGKMVYTYENSAAVKKNNVMLVNLKIANPTLSYTVTFSMGDTGVGESWETAYELEYGKSLNVGTPTAKMPIWVKIASKGGDLKVVASDQASGSWYAGDEAAEAGKATSSFTFSSDNSYEEGTVKGYLNTWTDTAADNYYMKLTNSWDYDVTLTLLSNTSTSIDGMATENTQSTEVYNLQGQKVANNTAGLKQGIYIVGGKKVVVK